MMSEIEPASDEIVAALKTVEPLDILEYSLSAHDIVRNIQALIARLEMAEKERDELLAKLGAALSEF